MKESSEHCIFIYVEKHQVTTFVLPVSILSVHLLPLHVTLSFFLTQNRKRKSVGMYMCVYFFLFWLAKRIHR